jgi:hypothetical protein
MLSSITPLGQRGRGQSWGRTVIGFWAGAVLTAGFIFGSLGLLGEFAGVSEVPGIAVLIVIAAAAILDWLRIDPFGPHRQVNEDWLGRYRDWVVGFGFGAQLGSGVATIVRTWSTWALFVVAVLVGWPLALLIGVAFGVGRSVLLLSSRGVQSSAALSRTMRRFAGSERWAVAVLSFTYVAVIGLGVLLGS